MDIFKLVFISLYMGNHELHTLYVKGNEIVIESQFKDLNYSQWSLYNFERNILTIIDNENNISEESISQLDTAKWEAIPPLLIETSEDILHREYREDNLNIKTKSELYIHEYELSKFSIVPHLKESQFFNFLFDINFPLVLLRRDFNFKNQEIGNQKLEKIEKISENEFNEVLLKFKKK
jgi:hypothetical protein